MKRALVILLFATPAFAQALNVVSTSSPEVNYVFSTSGSVTVTDMVSSITGGGFLQSRVFQGQAGSPADGKWVYEYRISRVDVSGTVYVNLLSMPWEGGVRQYDYNFDTNSSDQLYVVTSGGLGSKGILQAGTEDGAMFFYIDRQVDPGESSYFFGVVSDHPPRTVSAQVWKSDGSAMADAYAPDAP